ncbi:hypothetical protein LQ939_03725 [Pantoea alhagi]|uniref:hypothetical protein n=1 Tax=Pantoea alhagi TaxID=1891675 RepID=UPI00202ACD98|nr:hypothetical protein [Pantoea alhagi]URQ61457.1 hypothetical protein LQ939_03725 [Pantoea alhagi]
MRELQITEIQAVSGALMPADVMLGMGYAGLALNIPVIVGGAILGVPTLGLGFLVMTAGIVGTAISGGMTIMGIIAAARERKTASV